MVKGVKNFASDLIKMMNIKWSYSNTFYIQIIFGKEMKKAIKWNDDVSGRDINLNIVNINTPDFSNSPIEVFVGGQYRIHNGKDELYRFSITFRDQDQMQLYRTFLLAYRIQKNWYFDDFKMQVIINKEADYYNEYEKELMILNDCMIEGVSNIDINNNNEPQVAEFTVKFKCTSPEIK